jgi:stage II sporulation protein R
MSQRTNSRFWRRRCVQVDRPVRIQIGPDVFPDRTYNGTLIPAGTYQALKIIRGRAQGTNWWCVLYPPLLLWSPADARPGETSICAASMAARNDGTNAGGIIIGKT